MAKNLKTLILDKIEQFLLKTCILQKVLKMYTDMVTSVFLSRPSMEKNIKKSNHQHTFFAIFLSKAKTEII